MKPELKAQIEAAEAAYKAFEIKSPADFQKSLDLFKAVLELKGEENVKNAEEKMQAIEAAALEAKTANEAEIAELKSRLESTINGFDALQIRVKNDGRMKKTTPEVKSFGELLMEGVQENEGKLKELKKGSSVSFQLKAVTDMTFANSFPTADSSVAFVRPGIIEIPKRKLHIRELLPSGSMGAKSTFDYVKETAGEEGPETVNEAAQKNQFDLDLQEVSVPAEWIAGFVKVSRNMLDDVTGMTTFLQSRLPEKLLRVEDDQILNGNGTRPNLSGITDTGNYTAFAGAATIDVEQLVQAIAQLEGYDREANGILLNPADWYAIWLTKASGSGEYDLPSNLVTKVGNSMFIAGVPVYRSTAMTVDKFIVGDWSMGANFIIREPARVEFFYEDGTNVQTNQVTVRIEERVALPIYGSNYFIYGDFGNAS